MLMVSIKIEQIFLIGDKREYITAIVVPNQELMKETFNLSNSFFEMENPFIDEEHIISWIKEDMNIQARSLAKFEVVKNFIVKRTPFTVESGELTPTLKTKRRIIEAKYADAIHSLYHAEEISA
jgi:long-chain acyl-CoA synthetase